MTSKDLINIFWLGVNQGGNALFPLLLMPWLLITIGSDEFSRLVLAEVVAFYILTLCLYSFDVTQIKAVATAFQQSENNELSRIVYRVTQARLGLFALSATSVSVVVNCFALDHAYLIWLLFPLGMILQHNYFFQGCSHNKPLALVVFICRLIAMLLVYWLQDNHQLNAYSASWVIAGSYFLSGCIASAMLIWRLPFTGWPTPASSISLLRSGSMVFSGNMAVTLYRNSNVFILGLFATPHAVSIYAIAEKYIRMFQALARPLNDHYFAKIAAELNHNRVADAFLAIRQSTKPQLFLLVLSASIVGIVVIFAKLAGLLPGAVTDVIVLLLIMSSAILFGTINFMFGVVGLNNLGYDQYMTKSLTTVGIFSIIFCSGAVVFFQEYGAAVTFVLAEVLLSAFIFKKIWQVLRD